MSHDLLAFMLRGQPFHRGHEAVVRAALDQAEVVALLLGSHDAPRDIRNPFTTKERMDMIRAVFPEETASGRIVLIPLHDHLYNDDRWIAEVTESVGKVALTLPRKMAAVLTEPASIGLIGHAKDHTSYYLTKFPQWGSIGVANVDGINATDIRTEMFATGDIGLRNSKMLPRPVLEFLYRWMKSPAFADLRNAYLSNEKYKLQFASLPYPPIFQTVDSVVVQSGHILLIKRKANPGKGLWALPGGFLNQHETLLQGAVRELYEETKIGVTEVTLMASLESRRRFDYPLRSIRGRTITEAFYFNLPRRLELPYVLGSDDAEKAKWVPLSEVKRSNMFEDHYHIIAEMTGSLK